VLELQELQERLQYYRTALDAAKHRHMGWDGSWNKRVKKPTGDRKTIAMTWFLLRYRVGDV